MRRMLLGTREGGPPLTLPEHLALHGPLPAGHGCVLDDAGLRGRGGAGFPVARKLATARASRSGGAVLVNATESEPASLKDQALVSRAPHLVLDGAVVAARAVRAKQVVLVTHEGSPLSGVLGAALAERSDGVRCRVQEVPARLVSGESSAVARAVAGGPALPYHRERPLAQSGPGRRPAVVMNAESVAGLALLARHGSSWYAEVGTPDEPGTLLVTVRREGYLPTVLELPVGTPVGQALALAQVDATGLQAVLVGGWFGRWLPAGQALAAPLSHAGMRAAGGVLGAGVVVALAQDECGLRTTAEVVRRMAGESAGQCGPCVNGLPALATAFEDLVGGFDVPGALARVARYRDLVDGRGLCSLPDGTGDLARNAVEVFAADLEDHARGGCGRRSSAAVAVRLLEGVS